MTIPEVAARFCAFPSDLLITKKIVAVIVCRPLDDRTAQNKSNKGKGRLPVLPKGDPNKKRDRNSQDYILHDKPTEFVKADAEKHATERQSHRIRRSPPQILALI